MFHNRVWALFLIPFIVLFAIGILYQQIVAAQSAEGIES